MLIGFICHFALLMQPLGDESGNSDPQDIHDASQPESTHQEQLLKCREGILDPQARPPDRRRWVELLFSYDGVVAHSLVVELMHMDARPEVQRTICDVIRDLGRTSPGRLHPDFVDPLITLLGAEEPGLRTAAALALAELRIGNVPARLGSIAADGDQPLAKRLAAIHALSTNTHRRDVVEQLINLLGCKTPEVVARATAGLEPAALESFGSDVARWRSWWVRQSQLGQEQWLAGQLKIYRERNRRLADRFRTHREQTTAEHVAMTDQLRAFQQELFRAESAELRSGRLVEWLGAPLPAVQLTALAIIKARIADEGKRPEGEVLAALLRLLGNASPATRREALRIVQNLNDPDVVTAVLAQLKVETDLATRLTILAAIGKLNVPQAVPALIREIGDVSARPECVREAAIALGKIASQADLAETVHDSVALLKDRYHSAAAEDGSLRAALVTAMAGVAHASFSAELLDAVERDDPTILQPAIRGLRAIGNRSKLPRFRTLMQHSDAQVRLAAIAAITELGHEEADLESLWTRLKPTIEPNRLVRDAAWRGYKALLSRHSIQDRIQGAERLRDLPDLEIAYLTELADSLSVGNGQSSALEAVHERLALVLTGQRKYAEAIPYLRQRYDLLQEGQDPKAATQGLRWLDAVLRASGPQDTPEVLARLAEAAKTAAERERILDVVSQCLADPAVLADAERAERLLDALESVDTHALGAQWTDLLGRAREALRSADEPSPQRPAP